MAINACQLEAIKSRAEHGMATSQDCCDLLEYMRVNFVPEAITDKIETAVERAIEGAISQTRIVTAVEIEIQKLRL